MRPTKQKIEEIADWLECGMKVYFNHKTGEIINIIDFDKNGLNIEKCELSSMWKIRLI